jgi:hypothetical protein
MRRLPSDLVALIALSTLALITVVVALAVLLPEVLR